jgi:hypothetical protein
MAAQMRPCIRLRHRHGDHHRREWRSGKPGHILDPFRLRRVLSSWAPKITATPPSYIRLPDGDCLFMTGLLIPNDRLVTDRGEQVEGQPKAPLRSRLTRLLIAWPYIVPLLVLSVVYGRTVQRSTGNHFSIDTTKFDYLGLVLGTAHPPGYPLYTMLNAAFVRIVPWGRWRCGRTCCRRSWLSWPASSRC